MSKVIAIGEIMLRLSTNPGQRISTTDCFSSHFGGGEANVLVSLANFGHETYFVSKVPDNALGVGVQRKLNAFNVNTDFLVKGGNRLGVYYLEQGIGPRSSSVIYDREGSSFASMNKIEWDLDKLFGGCELIHLSGITPALSKKWQKMLMDIVKKAKELGITISYDSNYREKLWSSNEAGLFLKKILPYVDYLSAGKLDALHLLEIPEKKEADVTYYYGEIYKKYPKLKLIYATERSCISASHNQLKGILWTPSHMVTSKIYDMTPIIDRVGGGDAFSAAILHGILSHWDDQSIIEFGTGSSVLKHSIIGDSNDVTESEVSAFVLNSTGGIKR